jgi:hypothetical protein
VILYIYLVRIASPKVDRNKREPDDAGGVHREADELGLVEVLGNLARLDGVHRARGDQQHVVHLRDEEGRVVDLTLQNHLGAVRVKVTRPRRLHQKPNRGKQHLEIKKLFLAKYFIDKKHLLL